MLHPGSRRTGTIAALASIAVFAAACGSPPGDDGARAAPSAATTSPAAVTTSASTTTGTLPAAPPEPPSSTTTEAASTSTTTTTPPATAPAEVTTTTVTMLSAEEALAMAAAHYEALNDGRAPIISPGLAHTNDLRRALAFNARFDAECSVEGDAVVCRERMTDDFYGPAGFVVENVVRYRIDGETLALDREGSRTCLVDHPEPHGRMLPFVFAFDRWLHDTHPDVTGWNWLDGSEAALPCSFYPVTSSLPDARLAGFVAEFVEQSADYPLDPPVVARNVGW